MNKRASLVTWHVSAVLAAYAQTEEKVPAELLRQMSRALKLMSRQCADMERRLATSSPAGDRRSAPVIDLKAYRTFRGDA